MSIIRKEDWVQALGGAQGGVCAIFLSLPIESIQKMQGTSVGKPPGYAECCRTIMSKGGIKSFWRGLPPLLIQVRTATRLAQSWPRTGILCRRLQGLGRAGCNAPARLGGAGEGLGGTRD